MDPLTLSLIATIAGAGMQYYGQSQAAERAKQASVEAQQRQMAARQQATQTAMSRVQDYDPQQRQARQDQIQQEQTGQYEQAAMKAPITAQGITVGNTMSGGQGSDYLTAQAKEQAKTTASLRALASLMGRTGAATELRRREAIDIGDTSGAIGRIQNGAGNMGAIDKVGIDAAGRPDMFSQIAGTALMQQGLAGVTMNGLGSGVPGTNDMPGPAKAKGDPLGWWLTNGRGGD